MLLFVDKLVLLSFRDVFPSEFEALSCDEREEVMVLAPASVRRLEEQGQVLASCISATYVCFVIVMARIDSCPQPCEVGGSSIGNLSSSLVLLAG